MGVVVSIYPAKMVYKRFVEVGRVVLINYGPLAGKLAVVVNIVDQQRVQIDGPAHNVKRQIINLKRVSLTDLKIDIHTSERRTSLINAWNKANIQGAWEKTSWSQNLAAKARRVEMTDFDRFKLMKARKRRSYVIRSETNRLIKEAK